MPHSESSPPIAPISVVCPTYNSAKFVDRMFTTVTAQSLAPAELCICDDGSTDDTLAILDQLIAGYNGPTKCIVVRSLHKGPGAARNQAIKASSQPWVAFLDSDDEWVDIKIATVMRAIELSPRANFLCHSERRMELAGGESDSLYYRLCQLANPLDQQLYRRNFFSTSAVICRRSLLDQHGMFSEKLMSAQDYELWLRLAPCINLTFIPEILGAYIERKGNITNQNLLRRWRNEMLIAWRYRHYVGWILMGYRLLWIMGSFIRQFFRHLRSV